MKLSSVLILVVLWLVLVSMMECGKRRFGRRRIKNRKPQKQKAKSTDPDRFLERFGYLGRIPDGVHHSPGARREAIKNFQRMVGLLVTGRLDKETRDKMAAPRCGMPDMMPPGSHPPPPGVGLDPDNNPQNFYAPGYKWSKTDLTWAAHSFSQDLDRGSQRRAFHNALKYWSDVSPLTFREISSGDADIDINFVRRDHGDGNPFDGTGNTLAHAFYPENGDTHFDEDEHWTQGKDEGTNLEIVAAHEFGHALGLGHSNHPTALMAPYYQGYDENFQLNQDDIWGLQTLYGGPQTPTTPKPKPTTTRPYSGGGGNDKDPCQTKFGAVFQAHDTRIYVINGKYIYRLNDYGLDEGYPKRVTKVFERAPYSIGAAVYSWRSRYTYFFKGNKVFKYYGFSRTQKKTVKSQDYPSTVQAAFIGRDGIIYIFSGSQYWIFDEVQLDVTSSTGQRISSKWPGIPENTESSVRLNDGYIYFFKGSRYRKYDDYYQQVLPGYPKDKAAPWMGSVCGGQYVPK